MPVLSARGGRSAQSLGLLGGYRPEALALFARMTTPPTQLRKFYINRLINDLIGAGAWEKLGVLYVFAAADSQAAKLNWLTSGSATEVGSPTFTADRGYVGVSSGYLTGATNPVGSATDISFGTWFLTTPASSGYGLGVSGTALGGGLYVPYNGSNSSIYLGSATPSTFTRAPGYVAASRADAAGYTRRNGSANTSVTDAGGASTGSNSVMLWDGALGYYDGQLALAHYGQALTGSQLAAAETAFSAYLTAVGAI